MWPFKKYNCRKCKDTGFYEELERIPFFQLPPQDQAYILAFGGKMFKAVKKPCDHTG